MLIRCMIVAVVLVLATGPAAATQAQTSTTDTPVTSDLPADPGADAGSMPDIQIPTDLPPVMVPLPTLSGDVWTPAPRTKTTGCVSQGGLPDQACTPGAIDPRVTDATTGATICTSGYTATVRPRVSLTNRIKREQMTAYGLEDQPLSGYELDHLISLELGGSPVDIANLWPEPWTGDANAHQKDAVETHLKTEVCRGSVALVDAQRMIATDWLAVYRGRGLQPAP